MEELPMADPDGAPNEAPDPAAGPFLILHGLEGSGPGHWQPWLAERLAARGLEVEFPGLPDPSDPDPDAWLDALAARARRARQLDRGLPLARLPALAARRRPRRRAARRRPGAAGRAALAPGPARGRALPRPRRRCGRRRRGGGADADRRLRRRPLLPARGGCALRDPARSRAGHARRAPATSTPSPASVRGPRSRPGRWGSRPPGDGDGSEGADRRSRDRRPRRRDRARPGRVGRDGARTGARAAAARSGALGLAQRSRRAAGARPR